MSIAYNTDGFLTYPNDQQGWIKNALESIECTIAFDVKDWSTSRRDAWIYTIVFGWDDSQDEVAKRHSWDADDIERAKLLHEQWIRAKEWLAKEKTS
jgi:hypothetical protein